MDNIQQAIDQATLQARLAIANRCKQDLFYFAKYILGYDLMNESVHGDLCHYTESLLPTPHSTLATSAGNLSEDIKHAYSLDKKKSEEDSNTPVQEDTIDGTPMVHKLQDSFDPTKNFLLLLMPRGTFKSSVVTIGFSLQYILNDPNARILIDSETFSKCTAFMAEIKGHLEGNEKFREVFHTLYACYPDDKKKSDIWSNSELNIAARTRKRKEPTFSAGGIGTTKTGMHYDLVIGDDLVSENNITNKEQIDKVIDHYKLALSLLDPGKPLIIIGTRWDYNDLYQYIIDFEVHRFNVLVRKAIKDDGSLLFPERLTKEFLDNTKKSQGSYIFSCQYQNEPVDNESATFKASQIIRKDWELVKNRPINWYLSVDPSWEGQYSDYAAFVLAGMDFQRDLYVRYVLREKMTYAGIINAMFDIYTRYKPKQVVLETIAAQKSLQYMLNDEQKRRGMWMPVTEIRGRNTPKEDRIRGLAPYYEFGHIYHIREAHQLDELEYELIHFPKGTHDDCIDALATILEVAKPPSNKAINSDDGERKRKFDVFTKPRSPITGV